MAEGIKDFSVAEFTLSMPEGSFEMTGLKFDLTTRFIFPSFKPQSSPYSA
jgi:hypothetical protein